MRRLRLVRSSSRPAAVSETAGPVPSSSARRSTRPRSWASSQTGRRGHEVRHRSRNSRAGRGASRSSSSRSRISGSTGSTTPLYGGGLFRPPRPVALTPTGAARRVRPVHTGRARGGRSERLGYFDRRARRARRHREGAGLPVVQGAATAPPALAVGDRRGAGAGPAHRVGRGQLLRRQLGRPPRHGRRGRAVGLGARVPGDRGRLRPGPAGVVRAAARRRARRGHRPRLPGQPLARALDGPGALPARLRATPAGSRLRERRQPPSAAATARPTRSSRPSTSRARAAARRSSSSGTPRGAPRPSWPPSAAPRWSRSSPTRPR